MHYHYHAIYWWLVDQGNLWKAVVGVAVAAVFTWICAIVPWLRHRRTQAAIADRLDTRTPGGLTELVKAINRLAEQERNASDS